VLVCSSASLVVMAIEVSSDLLLYLFGVYFLWASVVVWVLRRLEGMNVSDGGSYFLLIAILVSFPGSVALFYKLIMGFCIYSCGFLVFLG